jgi:FKBP12-rapamycin complex-associated protein
LPRSNLLKPTCAFLQIIFPTPCRAVIRLLPRLAAFAPERFAQDYLVKCIAHLLAVLKRAGERGSSFAALADMASSLAAVGCQDGFEQYLGAIAAQVG